MALRTYLCMMYVCMCRCADVTDASLSCMHFRCACIFGGMHVGAYAHASQVAYVRFVSIYVCMYSVWLYMHVHMYADKYACKPKIDIPYFGLSGELEWDGVEVVFYV